MLKHILYLVALGLMLANPLYSRVSASQTMVINVDPVTEFVLKGQDPVINVPVGANGLQTGSTTKFYSGISYSYSCVDGCSKKIIGQLDRNTPDGFDINVYLTAPEDALSTGFQTLNAVETDLVININGKSNTTNAQIVYEIVIDKDFQAFNNYERKVIYTFLDQ